MTKMTGFVITLALLSSGCKELRETAVLQRWFPPKNPKCAAGIFLENGFANYCNQNGEVTTKFSLVPEAQEALRVELRKADIDAAKDETKFIIELWDGAQGEAMASFKPSVEEKKRVPVVRIPDSYAKTLADDGLFMFILLHEYGHVMQYLSGFPAGDQLQEKLCKDMDAKACTEKVTALLLKAEYDADRFALSAMCKWLTHVGANKVVDLTNTIQFIAQQPGSPTHPPAAERAATIRSSLQACPAAAGKFQTRLPVSREILTQFGNFAALVRKN